MTKKRFHSRLLAYQPRTPLIFPCLKWQALRAQLQILEDCYERKSVIITSQLPVAKWYDYIKEPTLADAIMDRLTANARRIELKGESLRRKTK